MNENIENLQKNMPAEDSADVINAAAPSESNEEKDKYYTPEITAKMRASLPPTSPIDEPGTNRKLTRRFLGETGFGASPRDKKEFEAYTKGRTHFQYKKATFSVRQEYFYQ